MKKFFLLFVVAFCLLLPTSAYAKAHKKPTKSLSLYKDVTTKKVDAESYEGISFVKKYGGWNKLTKSGKLYPNKHMTRRDFLICLHNLYGGIVTATMEDLLEANEKITSKFVCDRLASLSKSLGYQITWSGYPTKMKRKDVARYIKIFATYNPKLMPRK